MNRLLNPNRDGGYPLTGEALSILGTDIPAYINAILEQITPDNSVVFLSDSYAYVKWSGYKEIMACTLTGRTQAQLMAGAKSQSAVTETNYSDTVSGTTYSNTRCSRVIAISSSSTFQSGAPTFYDFESLLNKKLFNEVDYFNDLRISTTFGITNLVTTGHAILKGGEVDIDLTFRYSGGSGIITISLPDALYCNAIAFPAYTDPVSSDPYTYTSYIIGNTMTVHIPAEGDTQGCFTTVHVHYIPDTPPANYPPAQDIFPEP